MRNLSKITENLYLIIPSICIGLWALLNLVRVNFNLVYPQDFAVFYKSGKQIFINPEELYDVYGYFYLPSFAVFFSISISLLPLSLAHYVWYFINYILGVLCIREYSKILFLMNVKRKIHRFMFLIIISNGYFVYYIFRFNQTKFLVLLILLIVLRREFEFRMNEKEKDIKFYITNYGLFVFALSMAPYFILLLLIYVLHDNEISQILKRENIKRYCIVILMFLAQNFLFIIFPTLFIDFLNMFGFMQMHNIQLFYLREWVFLSRDNLLYTTLILIVILIVISFILMFSKKLLLVQKFGYFSIVYLLIGVFSYQIFILLILFSFILLIFVPFIKQNDNGFKFIKNNKILLVGLISILIITFMPPDFAIYGVFPFLQRYPLYLFVNLRWIFLICIFLSMLILLHIKDKN